jgi:hypothetical protein
MPFWKITSLQSGQVSAKVITVEPWNMSNFMYEAQNQNGYTDPQFIVGMDIMLEADENNTTKHPMQYA